MDLQDTAWSRRRVRILVDGLCIERITLDGGRIVEVDYEGPSYYELRSKALDTGEPTLLLDAIQLDNSIRELPSDMHRAAMILKLYGMEEHNIGKVLKGYKTGYTLVDEAIKEVARIEKKRYNLKREL